MDQGRGRRNYRLCYIEIEPGSTWENGYCESFNACCRDELLNGVRHSIPCETLVNRDRGSGDGITLRNGRISVEAVSLIKVLAIGYKPTVAESFIPM